MNAQTEYPAVDSLDVDAVDVRPVDRDWSEGYGDTWDYIAAPSCPHCGDYARWISEEDLRTETHGGWPAAIEPDVWEAWRCANVECEQFGGEIEREGDDGPMMNYAYPFPDSLDESDAAKIAHLPLCIVNWEHGDTELALSGGGMDLSWEICEAFMLLGYLPPAHFADLPAMAGRGSTGGDGQPRADYPERDAWIIAGARASVEHVRDIAANRAAYVIASLDRIAGR